MKVIKSGLLFQAFLGLLTSAQAPNTVAKNHPNLATQSLNATYFILPIPRAAAAQLASPYGLLTLPSGAGTIFPNGFPSGMHPVLVDSGYGNDIRMTAAGLPLAIPALLTATISLLFIDRLGNGKTVFAKGLSNFIGGINGKDVQGLVPALVGSGEGNSILVGTFDPNNAAYKLLTDAPSYSAQVKEVILPNPVSGPGITPSAIDLLFTPTEKPLYPAKTFNSLINQPGILANGQCQYIAHYFNESFAQPSLRTGSVTLYSPAVSKYLVGGTQGGAKTYSNAAGYSVVSETVTYNAKACSKFA